ncbi:dihydrolipoamide acetyltransferase family protein [Wenyingzhuangia sp. 2_MG-2023]|uniref:dihydrolipoamide acetyltransferase family protein n=1 Tax=Wenyingzhuangia sp. 2_MG-2023 TaxID=3062639 RepID=UPI0026E45DA2|nr:dihydrolipoamide acetyltransferase family protein [Wenyingzhuangia sp. 2_MG-2023]MDO6736933.1 dihydrolipoamide acetyltransferase family protein [Wenyingzhuangia sp. 2_MG-2023]MDO6801897.1 dihydrolipoamide acetyltransferase family protein [Wenyingzhuangia sp. 1_MG-2023]
MSRFELKLPKMGESVAEATITSWLKEVGDSIELDESVVEIATDKVDSDVPSEVEGVLIEKKFHEGEVVKVGQVIAVIEIEGELAEVPHNSSIQDEVSVDDEELITQVTSEVDEVIQQNTNTQKTVITNSDDKFYSPLVKNIAATEGISQSELDAIPGSGLEGRVTKEDILAYVENRSKNIANEAKNSTKSAKKESKRPVPVAKEEVSVLEVQQGDELITLSRMGKLISDHMVHSKRKAAHVQSFIEVDVTNLVKWRSKVKDAFLKRENQKLTYTPIFMMAVAQAIKKYPLVNIMFDGEDKIVVKKSINLGMASALPDGNLIVPVIKNAEHLNLVGMTKSVNDLALRSKNNQLKPEDVKGGTYTVTNIGGFGSIFGTPIINQPESAILALGAIRKVPAVIETPDGDFIGIRQKMYISHSYDHRVINGALGGMFIKEIKDILEAWDENKEF